MARIRLLSAVLLLIVHISCLNIPAESAGNSESLPLPAISHPATPVTAPPDTGGIRKACAVFLKTNRFFTEKGAAQVPHPYWRTLAMLTETSGVVSCAAPGASPQKFRVIFFQKSKAGFAFQVLDAALPDEEYLPDSALLASLNHVLLR